jgi:hypothetical protein
LAPRPETPVYGPASTQVWERPQDERMPLGEIPQVVCPETSTLTRRGKCN